MDAYDYINSTYSMTAITEATQGQSVNSEQPAESAMKQLTPTELRKSYSYSATRNAHTEKQDKPNDKLTKLNDVRFYKNFRGVKSNNLNSKVKIYSSSFLCSLR